MYPIYVQSSPQPCYRGQMPQFIDTAVQSDTSKAHPAFGPWPCNNSFSCASLPENNGYCNHHYPPGSYSFWPQPHGQPFPVYYNGPYPTYPNSYAAGYFPAPYYAPPGSYGCGCPNHPCHQNEYNSLNREKVEEQKPVTSKSSSVHPVIQFPNCPYPVALVHPSCVPDQRKETSNALSGWPFRMCDGQLPSVDKGSLNLEMLPQTDEQNKEGKISDDRSKMNWHFPLVWFPDKPVQEDKVVKEANENKKTGNIPGNLKIIPLKFIDGGNSGDKPLSTEKDSKKESLPTLPDKDANSKAHKVIPVKPIEDGSPRDKPTASVKDSTTVTPSTKEVQGTKIKTVPVKQLDLNAGKQDVAPEKGREHVVDKSKRSPKGRQNSEQAGNTGGQANPGKPARLPPICLRVDPLPKKKPKNETEHQDECKHRKEVKVMQAKDNEIEQSAGPIISRNSGAEEQAVTGNVRDENSEKLGPSSVFNVYSNVEKLKENSCDGHLLQNEKLDDNFKVDPLTSEIPKSLEIKKEQSNLSATDAATIIQSAFRGFQVRKWEPLKKLKQIARVHERINALKEQIDALEACSMNTKESNDRVVIGETIMNLLFSLDNIQGLHPCARDIRRDVVRELVHLQEKLDSVSDKGTKNHGYAEGADNCHDGHGLFISSTGPPKEETEIAFTQNNGEEINQIAFTQNKEEVNLKPSASGSLEQGNNEKLLMRGIVNSKSRPVEQEESCEASNGCVNTAMDGSMEPTMLEKGSNSEWTPIIDLHNSGLEIPSTPEEGFIADIIPPISSQVQSSEATSAVTPVSVCHIQSSESPHLENMSEVLPFIHTEIQRSKMENLEKNGSGAVLDIDSEVCRAEKQRVQNQLVDLPNTHVATDDNSTAECSFMRDNELDGEGCTWNEEAINIKEEDEHVELHGTSETEGLGQAVVQDSEKADLQSSLPAELEIQMNTIAQGMPNSEGVEHLSSEGQATLVQLKQETNGDASLQQETSALDANNGGEAPCHHPSGPHTSAELVEHSIVIEKDGYPNEESNSASLAEPEVCSNKIDTIDSCVSSEGSGKCETTSLYSPLGGLEQPNLGHEVVHDAGINFNKDFSDTGIRSGHVPQLTDIKPDAREESEDCLNDVLAHTSGEEASVAGTGLDKHEDKLVEENKELRAMLEKLLAAGKKQMEAMSDLNWRVRDLERKLSRKKRTTMRRCNGASGTRRTIL